MKKNLTILQSLLYAIVLSFVTFGCAEKTMMKPMDVEMESMEKESMPKGMNDMEKTDMKKDMTDSMEKPKAM